jgi:phosphomannomutase/phosphoglucomutase
MKEKNIPFGFEANGGGIFSEMLSRDAGRTTIELLNIFAREGKTLSQMVSELPKYYIFRDKIEYKWELKDKIIAAAKKNFKGIRSETIDGLKIWLDDDTWILFRSSLNAPEFRVFVESGSNEKAKKLIEEGLKFVREKLKV